MGGVAGVGGSGPSPPGPALGLHGPHGGARAEQKGESAGQGGWGHGAVRGGTGRASTHIHFLFFLASFLGSIGLLRPRLPA